MPLSPGLAAWLQNQGHDAVHAAEVGLGQALDAEIIAVARRDARAIVTADLDYPRLLALLGSSGPSVIVFRDGNWSDADVIARMDDLLRAMPADDLVESILVVERHRVRRRRLPIVSR